MSLLEDSQFGISADWPKEIVRRRKERVKKLIEARRSGKLAFFSCVIGHRFALSLHSKP